LLLFLPFLWADSLSYKSAILANNPVGYWQLNEGSGSTASDASGYGHNGVYNNVTFGILDPFGGNQAVRVNSATSSYINISDSGSTSLDVSYITIEAWIRTNNYDVSHDRGIVINKENSYEIGLQDGTGAFQSALYTSGWTWNGSAVIPLNTWKHIALSYNGSIVKHYVNGVMVDSYAYSGTIVANDEDLRIGARGGDSTPGSYFEGDISHVSVFDYALSDTQILTHYNSASLTIPEPACWTMFFAGMTVYFLLKKK